MVEAGVGLHAEDHLVTDGWVGRILMTCQSCAAQLILLLTKDATRVSN